MYANDHATAGEGKPAAFGAPADEIRIGPDNLIQDVDCRKK
jgi:hypothetical protein